MSDLAFLDLEAEQAVLGALMLDFRADPVAATHEVLPVPTHFGEPRHQVIYAALLALAERGALDADHPGTLSPLVLRDELERRTALDAAGGMEYLAQLIDAVPTAANLRHHALIVRDYALRRELARQGRQMVARAETLGVPVDDALAESVNSLVQGIAPMTGGGTTPLRAGLADALAAIEQRTREDRIPGVPTGLVELDRLTGGWAPGQLIVVAARPMMGKSSFALHAALTAGEAEHPVFYGSLEMNKSALIERALASRSRIDGMRLKLGKLSDRDYTALAKAAGHLHRLPVDLDDDRRRLTTPAGLRFALRQAQALAGRPYQMVVLDYLNLMGSGERAENRNLEVGQITRALKLLAGDLNVPLLLLAQLNRESVKGEQVRRPRLSDLRDSGAIEQDADIVVFLHRDELGAEWGADTRTEVLVAKQREGPTGLFDAYFERSSGFWGSWSGRETQEETAA